MKKTKHRETAFIKMLEQYKAMIVKIAAMYCSDNQERKDLVQEISLQLWKSFPLFDKNKGTTSWIYRIALNVSISYLRKKESHQKKMKNFRDHFIMNWSDDLEQENLAYLNRMISKLNNGEKALLILHLDGKNNQEIAEIIGISLSNVSTRLSRIRQKLSKMVNN